jgi:dinuclear metal center YbgI/SA1388 family protein
MVCEFLERWAPLNTQASYDNSGFQCGDVDKPVHRILTCLDFTQEVLEEAMAIGADLVIAHHPCIFKKISSVTSQTASGRLLMNTLRSGITVYALHTPADVAFQGVSFLLAETIGLSDVTFLAPDTGRNIGMGAVGSFPEALSGDAFLAQLSVRLHAKSIRYSGLHHQIKKVAVCGGSGSDLIDAAAAVGADAFVTADLKYHQFFCDHHGLMLVDVGHYESEIMFPAALAQRLAKAFPSVSISLTSVVTNPVSTYNNISSESIPV